VLDRIDLSVERGEVLALLGESGCGKSLTALSILRLLPTGGRITAGRLLLDGIDLAQLSEREMRALRGGRIGMIFQEPMTSLNPVMTIGAQIAEAISLHQPLRGRLALARAAELLQSVGIPDAERRLGQFPHQLSGGMKQRVMVAIALAGDPDLLIADEPTTALDVTIQAQVLELLERLRRERGLAILLITHDLGVAAGIADRVAVMYAGQIVETAPAASFFRSPCHPYSRKLFAALPDAGRRGRPLSLIPGTVPAPGTWSAGCRFAERCDRATSVCRQQVPAWTAPAPERGVRCHLFDQAGQTVPGDLGGGPVAEETVPDSTADVPTGEPLLRVSDLDVRYPVRGGPLRRVVGTLTAADGVSFEIHAGEVFALVGESGCGKTTVARSVVRLTDPAGGRIELAGTDLTALDGETLRAQRHAFQLIFQDPAASLNPRMRIGDILAEALAQAQGPASQSVASLLDMVGLDEGHARRYPHQLSGGQRQRVSIARALAVGPKLLVCDEPTSALDVSVQAQILNLLKRLQRELGLALLFISHDLAVVSWLADRIAVMYLGRIVEEGPAAAVMESPGHPYTQALLAAVPKMSPGQGRWQAPLGGELPSPVDRPSGCHFHPRCPHAMPVCRSTYPAIARVGPAHRVRCHLVESAVAWQGRRSRC